ncbi:hypothetical protein [Egicoccus halophilus]|uniref:Uncharacterized protein n=1 Tax=Egicoccus halophilus TaxID=1670830 RepID=A0A8J3ET43_9ACTN|nr:hypothetical protein [Egicoccus halophilus]GGI04845.1 hypothetical protein GCM10011354_11130 [Egicoccus halophilus]
MSVQALEDALVGARLWGLELDTRYRVLAATLELDADRYPWGEVDDRRVQLLVHPVSTVLASLRSTADDGRRQLHTFDEGQLVDVAAALGGLRVDSPLFGRPEPGPGEWGPRFSLEGRATTGDGTRHTLTIAVRGDDLELDLFASFDNLELKAPDGRELALPTDA